MIFGIKENKIRNIQTKIQQNKIEPLKIGKLLDWKKNLFLLMNVALIYKIINYMDGIKEDYRFLQKGQ